MRTCDLTPGTSRIRRDPTQVCVLPFRGCSRAVRIQSGETAARGASATVPVPASNSRAPTTDFVGLGVCASWFGGKSFPFKHPQEVLGRQPS